MSLAQALVSAERMQGRLRLVSLTLAVVWGGLVLSYLSHVAGDDLPGWLVWAAAGALGPLALGWTRLSAVRPWLPWVAILTLAGAVAAAAFPVLSQTQMTRLATGAAVAALAAGVPWFLAAVWIDRSLRRRLVPALAVALGLTHLRAPFAASPLHPWLDPGAPHFSSSDGLAGAVGGRAVRSGRLRCFKKGRISETFLIGTFCEVRPGWPGSPVAALRQGSPGLARAQAAGLRVVGSAGPLVLLESPDARPEQRARLAALVTAISGLDPEGSLYGIVAGPEAVQVMVSRLADPFVLGHPLAGRAALHARLLRAQAAAEWPLRLVQEVERAGG